MHRTVRDRQDPNETRFYVVEREMFGLPNRADGLNLSLARVKARHQPECSPSPGGY